MSVHWNPLTPDEHAAYEQRANRAQLRRAGGIWWRQVRPLFYRPLFLFQDLPPGTSLPWASRLLGAAQFPSSSKVSNSMLGVLVSDRMRDYSLARLSANGRNQVRKGQKNFVIRDLADPGEFVRLAHPVYLEFLGRTQYRVNQARRETAGFTAWADELYGLKKLRILGAFQGDALGAVSITFRVGEVVFYSVYFGNQQALKGGAADLMVHRVREMAQEERDVSLVFAAVAGMPRGLDRFYLLRGFQVLELPTRLTGNRLTLAALRWGAPRLYRRLTGQWLAESGEDGADRVGNSMVETS